MDIQTFYPVFEDGQVLQSENLNDIVDYLEPQDRLTRSRLIGIGVVCGFVPNWDPGAKTLALSHGAAVTSEGYLIAEDAVVLDRVRPYQVPIPSAPDATAEEKAAARYSFLFDGTTQRQAFELLPTDFQPAPGEAAPTTLSDAFVADKTVMLFLECNRESLKNCNVNDCSDKGSEMNLALRRLLVPRTVADKIVAEEGVIAGRPVDRANHPRLAIAPLSIAKINPAGFGIQTLGHLYARTLDAAAEAMSAAQPALRRAYDAYRPLLSDMFPQGRFPNGPFPDHHFLNMLGHWAANPALVQYLHGGVHDIVRTHNEFTECAARFDAECCPHPGRFPKHVLLGDPVTQPVAFSGAPAKMSDFDAYDPLAAKTGPAPEGIPAARRHHFVPSPALDAGKDKIAELRALFLRLVLLGQTHSTRDLLAAAVRITPSRDGAAPLGERAIPIYYRFEPTGDLVRNWSWRRARAHLLGTVQAHAFTPDSAGGHPLVMRQDEHDFLRIEGVVGKPLGTTMARLVAMKRRLGLSFAIDPVLVDFGVETDGEARQRALAAVGRLLMCRMRDLDVIFLMIMAGFFAFLVWLVQALGRLDATKAAAGRSQASPLGPSAAPLSDLAAADIRALAAGRTFGALNLDVAGEKKLRVTSEKTLVGLRTGTASKDVLIKTLAAEAAGDKPLEKVSVATIYDRVRDKSVGGELIDRVRAATDEIDVDGDKDELTARIYPSVALMARAEEMMEVASAPSIAAFDAERFGTAFRGFSDSYESYAAKAITDEAVAGKETAATNVAIVQNRGSVAASAAQFSGAAIMAELQKRLLSMMEDMTLPGYARKHPGMEHKGGVPVGGTFVLLYGDRADLDRGVKKAIGEVAPAFAALFSKLVGQAAPAPSIDKTIAELLAASKPQSDDILDQFVVLGDFCLPYMCCDTDCSDLEVDKRIAGGSGAITTFPKKTGERVTVEPAQPDPVVVVDPPPDPVVVERDPVRPSGRTGSVEGLVVLRQSNGREVARSGAKLVVRDARTGRTREQELPEASFKLELPEGTYALVAISGLRESDPVEVTVKAGEPEKAKLVIK